MSQPTIRVILVDDISDTRENLKKLLFFENDIEVVGTAGTGEEGIELAKRVNPDIVIMDINMPGIDGISAAEILSREVPGLGIIMMSVQGEADYLRRSMLAGAREFLIKPPTAEQVITSIRRVYALGESQRRQAAAALVAPAPQAAPPQSSGSTPAQVTASPQSSGIVIAVFGSKGGVGTSSIAVNLALALNELEPDARVAIVDGNTEFGDLSVLLNLSADRTIVDLISVEDLDPQYVKDVFISHASGIKVLPGSNPTEAELVTRDQVERLIRSIRTQFDFLIFDTRTTFQEPVLSILDNADTIVLITTADIPSIRNARLFFDVTEQLDYDRGKVKLVINKYDPQGSVSAQAIQSSIKHPVTAELLRDERTANSAIQQGLPFMIGNPRSPLGQGVAGLARTIAGRGDARIAAPDRRVAAAAAATPEVAEPPRKRSLFGRLFGR